MDSVLRNVPAAACYIDDVVVFSASAEQHVKDVSDTLDAIRASGMTCHPKKCSFGNSTVKYLGFEVQGGQLSIQQAKVEVLDRVPAPKDRSTLRAVLGFLNYYRNFVPNFSRTSSVLNRLLREDQAWQWGEEEQGAFKALIKAVKTGTVLTLPSKEDPFVLYTDWSSAGMGGILCQERDGQEMVVAFASRSCNPAEANYSSYEGEGLAAVWAITHFRVYLQGRPFVLVTDHQPLTWLMTNQALTGRNARWAMRLQEYEFTIRHRAGKTLQHVDGLSRNPPPSSPEACLVALAREIDGEGAKRKAQKGAEDIWEDEETLRWVQGKTSESEPASERARARGLHYRWYQDQLQKTTKEGWKLVPRPEEREGIIAKVHRQLGHYGSLRTSQLIETGWWWAGMRGDIKAWVGPCELCSRNKAELERGREELHSLPIRGIGFRWSLDLAGEMPLSRRGKRFILIMIEHGSKWVEVRALPSKSSARIAEAFEDQVLTRFGACGEVLTDQGTEFLGEFENLLTASGITHRRTSRYHPQSDGLTERFVQTVKKGLRAYGEKFKRDWDVRLPWVVAGYRFSKQAALKDFSPYYLLLGREPILPIDAPRVLTDVVTMSSDEAWVGLAEARARYLREMLPAALENLQVAQLRDAQRYKKRRERQAVQKGAPLGIGEEVYVKKARQDMLDIGLSTERWRVKEVKDSGVVVLVGDKGQEKRDHQTNVARARPQRTTAGPEGGGKQVKELPFSQNVHRRYQAEQTPRRGQVGKAGAPTQGMKRELRNPLT
ncbi:unnamed protein product [Closterium sp. Yama58-4]|nr:unnamed protein product [Closterium sp. Yama58-4]